MVRIWGLSASCFWNESWNSLDAAYQLSLSWLQGYIPVFWSTVALALSGHKPPGSIQTVVLWNAWGLFFGNLGGVFLPQAAHAAGWQSSSHVVMQLRLPQHAEPLLINLTESKRALPAAASPHSRRTWHLGAASQAGYSSMLGSWLFPEHRMPGRGTQKCCSGVLGLAVPLAQCQSCQEQVIWALSLLILLWVLSLPGAKENRLCCFVPLTSLQRSRDASLCWDGLYHVLNNDIS